MVRRMEAMFMSHVGRMFWHINLIQLSRGQNNEKRTEIAQLRENAVGEASGRQRVVENGSKVDRIVHDVISRAQIKFLRG